MLEGGLYSGRRMYMIGGLISGEGGGLIIGCYGMRVFLARLLNVMTDWVQVS